MSDLTVKDICQQALTRMGFQAPTVFYGSTDPLASQVFTLLNQASRDVNKAQEWQQLRKEFKFYTVAQEDQIDFNDPAQFPDQDFCRWVNNTIYNRSMVCQVFGPLTAQQWQLRKAAIVGMVYNWFTVRGNKMLFYPNPTAGQLIAFEYVSNFIWMNSTGDTYMQTPTADTDIPRLNSELFVLALKWRFREAKGLAYAENLRDFETACQQEFGDTTPAPILNLGGKQLWGYLPNVPEGNWNQ